MSRLLARWWSMVVVSLLVGGWATASLAAATSRVQFDFEDGTLQGWRLAEGEFGDLICRREFFFNKPTVKYNKQGKYYLSTLELAGRSTDSMTGVLESPVFVPRGEKVSFLVGGGAHSNTYVALCAEDGRELRRACGKNVETMQRVEWNLGELVGRPVFLRIVDQRTGSWGHVTFDDFSATGSIDAAATKRRLARLEKKRLEAYRRLKANRLLCAQPILFVVRHQYKPDHHNTATMFQTGEINAASFVGGAAIKTIDFARDGEVKTLLDLPRGVARDLEVSFDGRKILFSMRRDAADDYHVYEMNADGSGLRQLTHGSGLSDIDPIYLPDGKILFTSTREPKYCMCNRHIMGNLFVMEADGSNIQQIGHSTLHEGHSSLLPDGRVIYDRWEYVDRNFGDAQGVWSVNPDGTNHAIFWGNNTNSPGGVLDARAIPGTELFLANFSSCHDRPWGALAVVDRRLGMDGRSPVVRTWPANAVDLIGVGNYDTFKRLAVKYEDPYPLSDKQFLCSRMTGKGEQTGIVLIDVERGETLLHAEEPGCYDPMPLAPREKPPIIPSRIDLAKDDGYFYVADVYVGSGMAKIPRGTIKSLRVVESPEKRFWTQTNWQGSGTQAPGMAWDDYNNKRILGTVPVEPDGSVYLAVPADTFVYFQLLDDRGRMVQSMRSGTIVRPGETIGCVGCHEGRHTTLPGERLPTAMRRGPRKLAPWHGPARTFNYVAEVQPVFDRHCVSCHDYGKPAGKTLNLTGDLGLMFNTSYFELRKDKRFVNVVGAGPTDVQPPKSWGSHASRLATVVLEGHGDPEIDRQVNLDPESIERILTWIDVNGPYYPEYASAYRDHQFGRSPLDAGQIARLSKLTGVNLTDQKFAAHVSFTRPELSPCLAKFKDKSVPEYREALAIIEAGKDLLAQRPRADMPGFKLTSPVEIGQEKKYQARLEEQARQRAAIMAGQR